MTVPVSLQNDISFYATVLAQCTNVTDGQTIRSATTTTVATTCEVPLRDAA